MLQFGLRLRVFLFFCLLAAGALAIAGCMLMLGWSRADPSPPLQPFVTAFVGFSLLNTGLLLAIWLLFDENVAKPINRLSSELRMRVHSTIEGDLDANTARYLGDLAPAAAALSDKATSTLDGTAAHIARETARLGQEHAKLTALLTESPLATILLNPANEIVLYDAQAASILAEIAPPRLKARLEDYVTSESLKAALECSDAQTAIGLAPLMGESVWQTRVKSLGDDGYLLFIDPPATGDVHAARPLVFDFDLITAEPSVSLQHKRLSELCYVVLDLETTGLSVERDAIVQLGAVRVLNGDLIEGEELSTYVDPGRPIPAASTRIHRVSDADVKGAPSITDASRALHHFARDAVLVAHNAPFDIGLLKRCGPESGLSWEHPVLDTVLLSAVAFGTTEDHSLDELCQRLHIQIAPEERHTALGDARVTAKALMKLLRMLEGQGYESFAALKPSLDRQARRLYTSN